MKTAPSKRWLCCVVAMTLCGLSFSSAAAENPAPLVAFQQKPGNLFITIGGNPFATYVYEDSTITRPYFAHVKTPCGIQATRNHPPQADDPKDHPTFHPGIWLAFGDINGNDYWRLKAKVEHEMFVQQPVGGPGQGSFTVRNYYLSADGKDRVCAERVKYTILTRPSGYLLLSESTFSSESGDFTFGDQEEFGLGVRVNTRITVQYGKGHITNAEGLKDGKEVWGKASRWVDYSGPVEDKFIGMAIMPDPANFRPSWYHARDYGFVAANPFGRAAMMQGDKSAVTVRKGETFKLGFGVLVYCSPADSKPDIAAAYNDFVEVLKGLKK